MKYVTNCPCCNKELNIEIIESGGETTATLSYPQKDVSRDELAAHGYELGTTGCKLIFNSGIARKLIQLGNKVIDIKPQKENPNKTTFVFEYTDKFAFNLKALSE